MDAWEVGSVIAVISINAGVALQLFHIWYTKRSDGLSLVAWFGFAITLTYMAAFSVVKNQHWTIMSNYCVSAVLHISTAILAWRYKRGGCMSVKGKKTLEEKIAERHVTPELVVHVIKKVLGVSYTEDMGIVPEVSEKVFESVLKCDIIEIREDVGSREFNFESLRKEILKLVRPRVEEYLDHSKSKKIKLNLK